MCENPCNRWHGGMKEAFKKINERGYTTKEGWKIRLKYDSELCKRFVNDAEDVRVPDVVNFLSYYLPHFIFATIMTHKPLMFLLQYPPT